jgi:hypothetical protein
VSEALLRAAHAGDLIGLFLILRDLGEGRIPPEVKGEVRSEKDSLTFEKFCEVWEAVYRVSDDSTQKMMRGSNRCFSGSWGFETIAKGNIWK